MSLFQKSVLNKHLNNLDDEKVGHAYAQFQEIYNLQKIEQIKQLKEEEYQDGFLRDVFVDVLGYVLRPEENHNLQREFKNQSDGKKADGAILKEDKALAIIELKSTITKDLTKVTAQAFNYKNNQPDCKYVITSNFQKLRFYIDYAHEYEEFDLFNLQKDEFKLLYLILHKDNLLAGLPLQIKKETKFHEQEISSKLYKDYSHFKHRLFENLIKNHPEQDKLILFKKSQKLLDRFLFILFAEDSGLLPPNSISRIIKRFNILKREDAYKPLYEIYQQYFNYMNTGRKGQTPDGDIPAYNGGLFYPDEFLDSLKIDDEALIDDLLNLSAYDFNTEVDVNILGHIFEHSLSEIEEITAQIEGTVADKSKSKRKKDGVFYTPKYITQYIVDNTIGALCNEKRIELNIEEIQFDGTYRKKSGALKETGKQLFRTLNEYKQWLLSLKILDPACGSGAFLNQALNFLIEEHKKIDDILEELTGHSLPLFDTDKSILENNLFGVDINEESVEIAQLSLWLRTAKKGRKLSSLNDNIKCGNSLIDDPEVAGEKAFDWNVEFKDIMDNGGFDVVIGNPPYVRQELVKQFSKFFSKRFKSFSGKADLFIYFYEKGIELLKISGKLSFISSGKFFEASYGKPLIDYLMNNVQITEVLDFKDLNVFDGISAYPLILTIKKSINKDYLFRYQDITKIKFNELEEVFSKLTPGTISNKDFINNDFQFIEMNVSELINKLNKNSKLLSDMNLLPLVGVKTGFNEGFITHDKNSQLIKNYVFGKNIKKYSLIPQNTNIIFPYQKKNKLYSLVNLEKFNNIESLLKINKDKLEKRAIIKDGIHNGTKQWFEYQQINKLVDFDEEYIVYPNVSLGNNFTLSKGSVIDMTGFIIPTNDKYLLTLLNSKITKFLMEIYAISRRGGYLEYKIQYLKKIPFKEISIEKKKPFIEIANKMLDLNKHHQQKSNRFINRLIDTFELKKISKKLTNFYDFEFKTLIAELKKQKITLSLTQQDEWEDYFNSYKIEINTLQDQIIQTEQEIDKMVYKLYGLTDEEIEIIEQG